MVKFTEEYLRLHEQPVTSLNSFIAPMYCRQVDQLPSQRSSLPQLGLNVPCPPSSGGSHTAEALLVFSVWLG